MLCQGTCVPFNSCNLSNTLAVSYDRFSYPFGYFTHMFNFLSRLKGIWHLFTDMVGLLLVDFRVQFLKFIKVEFLANMADFILVSSGSVGMKKIWIHKNRWLIYLINMAFICGDKKPKNAWLDHLLTLDVNKSARKIVIRMNSAVLTITQIEESMKQKR
jgi:hypothetical protein